MTNPNTTTPSTDTNPGGCSKCGKSVAESPSDDFCSEECQTLWRAEHTPILPGHDVLDLVQHLISRFNIFPSPHCAPMLALWYAHTHAADHLYVTPRLILSSVEAGSGKTRVLEVAQFLVRSPEMTMSATAAALFRMVNEGPITILLDEVDAIFSQKAGGSNEDLRALLNAGYKRSATIPRCVGDAKSMKVQRFPVYAPAALAGLAGNMPDTITTRAITVHMQRRREDEEVDEFWEEDVEAEAAPLREMLAAWITTVLDKVSKGRPEMPTGVRDRSAEIWRPLIAIADAAGGDWPDTAREACSHFVEVAATDRKGGGLRLRLLSDLRDLFESRGVEEILTSDILTALCALDESPWGDLDGKALDSRRLASELKPYGVASRNIKRFNNAKGYHLAGDGGLTDVWSRYLPGAAPAAPSAPESSFPRSEGERIRGEGADNAAPSA